MLPLPPPIPETSLPHPSYEHWAHQHALGHHAARRQRGMPSRLRASAQTDHAIHARVPSPHLEQADPRSPQFVSAHEAPYQRRTDATAALCRVRLISSDPRRTQATGGADGTTRLWNVADPAHAAPLSQPLTGEVLGLAFSPDDRYLAGGARDDAPHCLPHGGRPTHQLIDFPSALPSVTAAAGRTPKLYGRETPLDDAFGPGHPRFNGQPGGKGPCDCRIAAPRYGDQRRLLRWQRAGRLHTRGQGERGVRIAAVPGGSHGHPRCHSTDCIRTCRTPRTALASVLRP